jgi:hypothetical protein
MENCEFPLSLTSLSPCPVLAMLDEASDLDPYLAGALAIISTSRVVRDCNFKLTDPVVTTKQFESMR